MVLHRQTHAWFEVGALPLRMPKRLISTGLVMLGMLLPSGCGIESQAELSSPVSPQTRERAETGNAEKLLDGRFIDWADGEQGFADGRWVWLRFSPKTRPTQAIQAAPFTTRIRIDTDMNPNTGTPIAYPRTGDEVIGVQPQGVDLLIEFSPVNEQGGVGIGAGVRVFDAQGSARSAGHSAISMACLPTHSSEQYELRLDRLAPESGVLPESGMIEVVVDQVDASGTTLWWQKYVVELPVRDSDRTLRDLKMPAKDPGSVRVMSANVLFSSPLKEPAAFKRLLDSAQPEVILYQEWFRTERAQVEGWLKRYAGEEWSLHFPDEDAGVAIATKGTILARYDRVLPPSGQGRPARACAALIDTDAGELLAISVHLKCCGAAGGEEDLTRIDQARGINAFVDWVHQQHPDAMVVIAGDFNLVGSRTPLEVMARGLGIDGDDLDPALTPVLGDASVVTWVDEKSRFAPGRLDWLLYDDSRSVLGHAFMIDTRVLSDSSLETMGLERGDSQASDHLPMIVDLRRAP